MKIRLFIKPYCPWCHKAKKFFTDRHMPFSDTDFDLADEATQTKILKELDAAGATGFPYAKVGDQVILGYQPEAYAKALSP